MQTSGYEGSQFPCQSAKGIAFVSNTLTYDQFINSSFEELENLGRTTPSPARHLIKDKKSYMG